MAVTWHNHERREYSFAAVSSSRCPALGSRCRGPHSAAEETSAVFRRPEVVRMQVSSLEWAITLGVTVADPLVRRRGDRASAARTDEARDGDLPDDLHRARSGVRAVGVVLPRQPVRCGVLRRLAHGVQLVRRQPVHLPDHHGELQRSEEVSAAGAVGRHHPGVDLPRHLHRAWRGGDQAVLLDLLRLRSVPGLHRVQPRPRHGSRRRRRELRRALRAAAPEPHRQVGRRPQALA